MPDTFFRDRVSRLSLIETAPPWGSLKNRMSCNVLACHILLNFFLLEKSSFPVGFTTMECGLPEWLSRMKVSSCFPLPGAETIASAALLRRYSTFTSIPLTASAGILGNEWIMSSCFSWTPPWLLPMVCAWVCISLNLHNSFSCSCQGYASVNCLWVNPCRELQGHTHLHCKFLFQLR